MRTHNAGDKGVADIDGASPLLALGCQLNHFTDG